MSTHSRELGCGGLLHAPSGKGSLLLCLRPLLLCKRLLLQLLLPYLLPLVAGGGPLDHLHGVQVAVGGLAVHGCLNHSLGGVGGLVLLHLLLFPGPLLHHTSPVCIMHVVRSRELAFISGTDADFPRRQPYMDCHALCQTLLSATLHNSLHTDSFAALGSCCVSSSHLKQHVIWETSITDSAWQFWQGWLGTNLQVHLLVFGANAGQAAAVYMQRGFWYRHVLLHDFPGLPLGDLLCQGCL